MNLILIAASAVMVVSCGEIFGAADQYIVFNRAPGQGMNQSSETRLGASSSRKCWPAFPNRPAFADSNRA